MKNKTAIDYIKQKPEKKMVNVRITAEVTDGATLAAEILDVPVYEVWEAAMRMFLEQIKPELKKASK